MQVPAALAGAAPTVPTVATARTLAEDYPSLDALRKAVPGLVLARNLHGVDIDPRAAQIASLALWLRAQRAWHDAGVKAKERPLIGRGHVVAAIAPPAERELRQQFAASLDQRDAELFEKTLQLLKGLPELGVLLQVEGLLTAKGGATSHAAVTIPQLSKVGVVGLGKLKVYESEGYATIEGQTIKTGDFICIDGWSGALYLGKHERETEKYYSITL